ncbi:MAG: hypothetical protein LAT54_03130 [Cryomorphaceae bacterium]|nr:hypothetical protein [Cryomorphaceae bacterium]
MQKTITPKKNGHSKQGPSEQTIKRLLNYSKHTKVMLMPDGRKEIINPN